MERVFVAGRCAFTIREAAGLSAGTLTVTITRDDRLEWTYQLASRRPLAVGSGSGSACLWSAREVVVLPSGPGEDPVVLSADEDLLLVFRTEAGWVLVCETSVRLVTGREEISRIELADTVRRAWWTGAALQVQDARGTTTALTVAGDRLVAVTPGRFVIGPRP
jgi:hypothetical protein